MIHRKLRPEKDGSDITLCQWDPEKVKEKIQEIEMQRKKKWFKVCKGQLVKNNQGPPSILELDLPFCKNYFNHSKYTSELRNQIFSFFNRCHSRERIVVTFQTVIG